MRSANPLLAQWYGTNCAKEFVVTGDKSCVFFTCFTEQEFTKLNLAPRRNKFARLADRIDNFEFGSTGSFAAKRGGGCEMTWLS